MSSPGARVAVFLHDGSWDRVHQGLSIAASAAALRRPVDVFLFWWALDRFARGELDGPEAERAGDHRWERLSDALERRGAPTLRDLLEACRASSLCTVYACSASLGLVERSPGELPEGVDQVVGWPRILQLTAGVTDRFYL